MPKRREKDGAEFWKAQCRKLQKEVQQLRRELNKRDRSQEDEIADDSEDTPPAEFIQKEPCHSCGKGFLDVFEIMGKRFGTCTVCGERKKLNG